MSEQSVPAPGYSQSRPEIVQGFESFYEIGSQVAITSSLCQCFHVCIEKIPGWVFNAAVKTPISPYQSSWVQALALLLMPTSC